MRTELPALGVLVVRFLTALLLVYTTFNPEGVSYFHWTALPLIVGEGIGSVTPLKIVAGILLLIAWLVFLQATRRSLGVLRAVLLFAITGAIVWVVIDWHLIAPASARAVTHLALVVVSLGLTVGLSLTQESRRIAGALDPDRVT